MPLSHAKLALTVIISRGALNTVTFKLLERLTEWNLKYWTEMRFTEIVRRRYTSAHPTVGAKDIVFSGCPSVCACVCTCAPRCSHSQSGLPSTSSLMAWPASVPGAWTFLTRQARQPRGVAILRWIERVNSVGTEAGIRRGGILTFLDIFSARHNKRIIQRCGIATPPW